MRYIGGKYRHARRIANVIAPLAEGRTRYVEPFVGGGASLTANAPLFQEVHAGDAMADIALMWSAVFSGWRAPESVSEDEYAALRHAEPSALRGFVGFGCSFGGKWFGGYARGARPDGLVENPAAGSARSLARTRDALLSHGVDVRHCSFDAWTPLINAATVVYCDPPYAGTTGYDAVGSFSTAYFWETAEAWAETGALVLVSEYTAPDNWRTVWQRSHPRYLQGATPERPATTERLFMAPAVEPACKVHEIRRCTICEPLETKDAA